MPIHNGTEWKTESAWWVKVSGEWKKSTTIWKKVSGVWEKMKLLAYGLVSDFYSPISAAQMVRVGDNIYACDLTGNRIIKISIDGVASTFAGSGTAGSADGVGTLAEFDIPYGITHDSENLYVGDVGGHTIRKIEISTATVSTFAGSGTAGSADGVGTLAEFDKPTSLYAHSGYIYVCDELERKIRKIEISTATVSTFAGSGTAGSADGVGTLAEFNRPTDITLLSDDMYVTDYAGESIRKIEVSTATVSTIKTGLDYPTGITTDGTNLFFSESNENKIKLLNLSTFVVSDFAGSGSLGDTNGVGTLAEFDGNWNLLFAGDYIYVSDGGNSKIRKINMLDS